MASVSFSTSASQTGSGTKTWTYTNSDWSSQLDSIPAYANITKCTLHVQGKGSIVSANNHKMYVYVGSTQIASNTDVDTSYETIVNTDIKSYVKNNSSDSGSLTGDLKIEANRGTYRESSIKVDITWEYTMPTYTVTLNANGGTVSVSSYNYTAGYSYGTLPTPTREGYTFNYWMLSDGTKITNTTLVTSNHTIYANWTINTYVITTANTPNLAGSIVGGGNYTYGTTTTITANANVGYKFIKWSDGVTTPSRSIYVNNNATYTAIYEIVYITYDSIFSFEKWKNIGISASGATISNITNTGFTLTCNQGSSEGSTSSHFFPVTAGKKYKVDIDIVGDNWDVYIFFYDDSMSSGLGIDFSDSLNRYSSNGTGVSDRVFTAPAGSVKAFIRVDANGPGNTVSYSNFRIYPAGYDYMSSTVSALNRSNTFIWNIPIPIRDGYKYTGWNTEPDGTGIDYSLLSSFPTDDITLYSQWDKVIYSYVGMNNNIDVYCGTKELFVYCGTQRLI